jgi:hypothetical protein
MEGRICFFQVAGELIVKRRRINVFDQAHGDVLIETVMVGQMYVT